MKSRISDIVDKLKLGSTAALNCRTGQNKGRCCYNRQKLSDVISYLLMIFLFKFSIQYIVYCNLKKPACASKQVVLELLTLWYLTLDIRLL